MWVFQDLKAEIVRICNHSVFLPQVLKRKERELEHELDRLVRRKIESQQQLDLLKIKNGMSTSETVNLPAEDDKDDDDDRLVVVEDKDIHVEVVDPKKLDVDDDDDQASTSTASGMTNWKDTNKQKQISPPPPPPHKKNIKTASVDNLYVNSCRKCTGVESYLFPKFQSSPQNK